MESSTSVSAAATGLANAVIGKNPKTWGVIFIALIVALILLIIICVVYVNRYNDCMASHHKSTMLGSPLGNLSTGSNNPMWHYQMGDAGWGGPLHSSYQHGESRVWGASSDEPGRHDHHITVPQYGMGCGDMHHTGGDPMRGVHPAAAEAHALKSVQAYEPASMKHLNDDDLIDSMNGTR